MFITLWTLFVINIYLNKQLNKMYRSVACCRSPSYQVSGKKSSQQESGGKGKKQQQHGNHSTSPQQPHSGVILEASTVAATVQQLRSNNGGSGVQMESVATPSAITIERKPTKDGLTKVLRNVATSSISGDGMEVLFLWVLYVIEHSTKFD